MNEGKAPFFPDKDCNEVEFAITSFMEQLHLDISRQIESQTQPSADNARKLFRSADKLMTEFLDIVSRYSVKSHCIPDDGKAVILIVTADLEKNMFGTNISAAQSEMTFCKDDLLDDGHSIDDAMNQLGQQLSEVLSEATQKKHAHPYLILYAVPTYIDDVFQSMTVYGMTCSATMYKREIFYDTGDSIEYFPTHSITASDDSGELVVRENEPFGHLTAFFAGVVVSHMPKGDLKTMLSFLRDMLASDDDDDDE